MFWDEYIVMHLTPHGWVKETEKMVGRMIESPMPNDAVLSLIFHETIRGLLSQKEQWIEAEYRIDRSSDMIKILFETFGKIPEQFKSWNINSELIVKL